ncbi:ABC transporter permease [Streptomyces tsukubensis]|uniref:RsiG family protein n=1 Tax=Streptomyces tsukubensis TaxID=83656 RepID=UPI0036A58D6A
MSTSGTGHTTADPAGPTTARPPQQREGGRECRAADHFPDPPRYELPALLLPELRTLRRSSQQDEADLSYVRRLLQGRIDILRAELARRSGPGAVTAALAGPGAGAGMGPGAGAGAGAVAGPDAAAGAGPEEAPAVTGPAAPTAAAIGSASVPPAAPPGSRTPAAPGPGSGAVPAVVPVAASVVDRLSEILADAPSTHRSSARHVTVAPPHSEKYGRLAADMLADVELSDLQARTDDELHAAMARLVRYEQRVSRRRQLLQRTADDCSAEITRRYREGEAQVDDLLT